MIIEWAAPSDHIFRAETRKPATPTFAVSAT